MVSAIKQRSSGTLSLLSRLVVFSWCILGLTKAFAPLHSGVKRKALGSKQSFRCCSPGNNKNKSPAVLLSASSEESGGVTRPSNPDDVLAEEERKNLFQFLLRDLQVEGVPLLGIDGADQVETMQAALWTTMAELWTTSQGNDGKLEQACLIFEEIPIDALRAFVDNFESVQAEERITQSLPELMDFKLELVGKGVGPAIRVKVGEDRKKEESVAVKRPIDNVSLSSTAEPASVTAALQHFVDRIVLTSDDGIGLQGDNAVYRVSNAHADACHVLSAVWNGFCELQATPDVSSVVLGLAPLMSPRHVALTELINRSICLYRGDSVFELVHYHPTYDRDEVFPQLEPVYGHLPPTPWFKHVVEQFGDASLANSSDLHLANYQRRAPVPAVVIKRVSLMDSAAPSTEPEVLEVGDGAKVPANGISMFAESIASLISKGEDSLREDLEKEITMTEK